MAADARRTVNIILNVIGDAGSKLQEIAGDLEKIASPLKELEPLLRKITRPLGTFSKQLEKIKKNVPDISPFVKSLEKLDNLNKGSITALFGSLGGFDTRALVGNIDKLRGAISGLIDVSDQYNQVRQSATNASRAIAASGRAAEQAKSKFSGFKKHLNTYMEYRIVADIVLNMREGLRQAVVAITEYNQSLKDLQAITGATTREVAVMGAKIIEVASTTKFSAQEVAEGMKTLGQAGFSASEAVQTMQAVSDLATGTLSEMATTVDLITTAMRVFNISSVDSSHVADVFANAVNRSKLTIDKLRTSMNYVGPIARDIGVSFEETAASMMVLANSGLRASTIGTGLRRVFAELAKPSEKFRQAARDAGVALADLNPEITSMQEVIQNLGLVIKDTGIAFDLFGKRGASAVLALTQDDSSFTSMLDNVYRSGAAAEMASIQMEGLGVSFKNLKDKLGLFAIALGNAGIEDVFKAIVDASRVLVDAFTMVINDAFGNFIVKAGIFITSAALVVKALKAITVAAKATAAFSFIESLVAATPKLTALAGSMGLLESASVGMAAATTVAIGPLLAIVTGIGSLVYVIGEAMGAASSLQNLSDSALNSAQELGALSEKLQKYFSDVASLKEGSLELTNKNKELRTSLIKVSLGMSDVSKEAQAALNSISPLNGEILDGGEALNKYAEALQKVQLQKFVSATNRAFSSLQASTSLTTRQWNWFKDSMILGGKEILTFTSDAFANIGDALNPFKAEFTGFANTINTWKLGGAIDESYELAKAFNEGAVSFKQLDDYIRKFDGKLLPTAQLKDLAKRIQDIKEKAQPAFEHLVKIGVIDTDYTVDQMRNIIESLGYTGDSVDIIISKFRDIKEVVEKSGVSNIIEKWGKDAQDSEQLLSSYIDLYKELKGAVDDTTRAQLASAEIQLKKDEAAKKNLAARLAAIEAEKRAAIQEATTFEQKRKIYAAFEQKKLSLLEEAQKIQKRTSDSSFQYDLQLIKAAVLAHKKKVAEINAIYKDGAKKNAKVLEKQLAQENAAFNKTLQSIANKAMDPKQYVKNVRVSVSQVKSEYIDMYKEWELLAENRVKSDKQKAAQKAKFELEAATKIAAIWKRAEEEIAKYSGTDSEQYIAAKRARLTAESKAANLEVKLTKVKNDEILRIEREAYQRSSSVRSAALEEFLATLEISEAKGVISHEKAEQAKVVATLNALKEEYNAAIVYRDKIDKVSNKAKWDERDKDVLRARRKYFSELTKLAKNHNKELQKLEKDSNKSIESEKKKYASSVEKIEKDLAKSIESINKGLVKSLKKIEKERAANAKDTKNDILAIEQDAADKIREVRQRGMTDEQLEVANRSTAYRKIKEGVQLVAKAKKEADLDMLKRGQELIKQGGDLGASLEDQSKAIGFIKKAEKELKNARDVEGYIKDLELQKKKQEELAAAEQKRRDAEAKVAKDKKDKYNEYQTAINQIKELYNKAVSAEKDKYSKIMSFESERHNTVMRNLDAEIAKASEFLSTGTGKQAEKPTGATSSTSDSINAITQATNAAKKSYDDFVIAVTESGKKIITTNDTIATGYSSFGKIIRTESVPAVQSLGVELNTIQKNKPKIEIDSNTQAIIDELNTLKAEYNSIGTKDGSARIFTQADIASVNKITEEVSHIFDGLDSVSAEQKLQDMTTVFNGMVKSGKVSSQQLADELNKILAKASEFENIQVQIDIQNGQEVLSLVDNTGKAIEGLNKKVQSNPMKLGLDAESVFNSLDSVDGALDLIKKKAESKVEPNIDTTKAEEQVDGLKSSIENIPDKAKTEVPITVVADTDTAEKDISSLSDQAKVIEASVELNTSDTEKAISDIKGEIKSIGDESPELAIQVESKDFDKLVKSINDLKDVSISVKVSGDEDAQRLAELLEQIESKKVSVEVDIIGERDVSDLKRTIDSLLNKTVKILAQVIGLDKVIRLKEYIDKLRNKTITITTKYVTKKAGGGIVEKFADGGQVFKRPVSRYVSSGSGTKDDVPALLWKGEFVHTVDAVRKYGREFMEMVNAGLYPVELARKAVGRFAQGGFVDTLSKLPFISKFAQGGTVAPISNKNLKRTLFELLNEHDNKTVVSAVNINNILSANVDKVTSELGQSSVVSLANSFASAISKFATGGSVSSDVAVQKASIEKDYNTRIQLAKQDGNKQIAELLQKEKEALTKIADELAKKLNELKIEFDTSMNDLEKEHTSKINELKQQYNEDKNKLDFEYSRDVQDDNLEYKQEYEDYTATIAKLDDEYRKKVEELTNDPKLTPEGVKSELNKYLSEIQSLYGKLWQYQNKFEYRAWENNNRKWLNANTFVYRRGSSTRTQTDIESVTPDSVIAALQRVSSRGRYGYGMYGADTSKKYTSEVLEIKSRLDEIASELSTSYGIDKLDSFRRGFYNIDREAPKLADKKLQSILVPVQEEYVTEKQEATNDWERFLEEFTIDVSRRDEDYRIESSDLLNTFKKETEDENTSYEETKKELIDSYNSNVAQAKEQAKEESASIVEQTKSDIEQVKKSVQDTINSLTSEKNTELSSTSAPEQYNVRDNITTTDNTVAPVLNKLNEGTKQYSASDTYSTTSPRYEEINTRDLSRSGLSIFSNKQPSSINIEELLKKLIGSRFRFNVGGFVPHLMNSIPGKDSILAALTPGEYVIKEPVVRSLGSDFFDAINNFKVPKFNLGGIVDNISNSIGSISTTEIKHALELTINGTTHEPLYGSQSGIDSILNDLAIAKMRS